MNFYFWDKDEYELAARAFDKDDPDGHIECLGRYAAFLEYRRRFDEASAMWMATYEAIMRDGEIGLDRDTLPTVINNLCTMLNKVGDYEKAIELAEPAADTYFDAGKYEITCELFMTLGHSYKKSGQPRVAVLVTQKAVNAAAMSNNDFYIALSNLQLAKFAYAEGLLEIAKYAAEVAEEKNLGIDLLPNQVTALFILGMVHLEKGQLIESEEALLKALALADHTHDMKANAMVNLGIGKLRSAMGDYKGSLKSLKKSYARHTARYKKFSVEARWLAAEITSKHIDPEKGKKMQEKARHLLSALRMEIPRVNERLF